MTEATQIDRLLDRIDSGEAVVGIVGLGYVGLPLVLFYFLQSGMV